MEIEWAYQKILRTHGVENKFDNFLWHLLGILGSDKRSQSGGLQSELVKLSYCDCAIVYNPYGSRKTRKTMVFSPVLRDGSSEDYPHLIMMAVLANMISNKDPELEALISKRVTEYLVSFEEVKKQDQNSESR